MQAAAKKLRFPDLDSGPDAPGDLERFSEVVEIDIGGDGATADTFSATACSPSWLSQECEKHGAVWGRHLLIGNRFGRAALRLAIEKFCSGCSGASWEDLTAQLRRLGDWEYASYDAGKRPASTGSFGRLVAVECSGRDLAYHLPDRTDSFRLPLRVTFGSADGHRAIFELIASTPNRLMEGTADDQFVLGHGLLVVGSYDSARIKEAIRHKCERLWGDSWDTLVTQMEEYVPRLET